MTLLSKTAMVRWNGYTRKHYESKGYVYTKANEFFECKIEDLMPTTTAKVLVKCDYCNENVVEKQYRSYLKEREFIEKDCCNNRKCMVQKSQDSSLKKYGVKSYASTEKSKNEKRKLYQTPISKVEKLCKEKGLKVLNLSDYENDRTKLFVICEKHKQYGIQETSFANIKKAKHCCYYARSEVVANFKRKDGNKVYREFIENGLIPKFSPEDYQNSMQPLPYICPNHKDKGIQYRSYSNLKYAKGCYYCSKERTAESLRLDEKVVFEEFKNKGLIPLEGEKYINKDIHIKYYCIHHPNDIQECTYNNLLNTKIPCQYCREERSISSLNRKLRSSLVEWRKKSEDQCNYRCVLTGSEDYEIHHLYSYNSIIKDALNELNIEIKNNYNGEEIVLIRNKIVELHKNLLGVCIHPQIHILFHQLYGKHDNTPEQFEEFKQRWENGEFRNIIDTKEVC